MGSTIKMYAAGGGGTENGDASVDIPMAGDLVGVRWAVDADCNANGEYVYAQLSFRSAGSFTTNDDRGVLSEVRMSFQLTTSGIYGPFVNIYEPLPDIPIAAGERLYLNLISTAGVLTNCVCILHFTFDLDKIASRRR